MSETPQEPCPSSQEILDALRDGSVDPLELARGLLRRALTDGDYARSLSNCHTAGVDSVVLYDDGAARLGMIRCYHARRGQHRLGELVDERGHLVVGIHNHHYQIAKISLNAPLYNVRTAVSEQETRLVMYESRFSSALRGGDLSTAGSRARYMRPLDFEVLHPGQFSLMSTDDLHTMQVIDQDDQTGVAWMVIEGPSQDNDSLIYGLQPDLEISRDGLYVPMDPREVRETLSTILGLMPAPSP